MFTLNFSTINVAQVNDLVCKYFAYTIPGSLLISVLFDN